MYKKFYNLKENPFKLSPSLKYYFISPKIQNMLKVLNYGIENKIGFIMISGKVGIGKTSFLRYFLSNLSDDIERAYLYNPTFSNTEDLLKFLLVDLKIVNKNEIENINSKVTLLNYLHDFLLKKYKENKKVLFIVDDAQASPDFILEELRLLSNFETNEEKLLQILLIGQPELEKKLKQKNLRQLNQRIGIKIKFTPFSLEETDAYINFRLIKAGAQMNFFDKKAIKYIHKVSKGLPRLINLIAERSLIVGYLYSKPTISKKEVKIAYREIKEWVL